MTDECSSDVGLTTFENNTKHRASFVQFIFIFTVATFDDHLKCFPCLKRNKKEKTILYVKKNEVCHVLQWGLEEGVALKK